MKNPLKAYDKEVLQIVGMSSKKAKVETIISFNDDDLEGIKFSHDDPLVIMPVIGNYPVKRVLLYGGVSVDILFYEAFIRMGYNDTHLTPSNMPVYGFNGIETKVEGVIRLPMTMGQELYEVTQFLNFLVVKAETSYNAILGRTGINAFQAVASTYHLKIKFPAKKGIGMEKRDQKEARTCYEAALRVDEIGGQAFPLEDMYVREDEERRGKPAEDLIPISLNPKDTAKVTYISASLQGPSKEKLTKFLQENSDVFAWTAANMPGIDPQLITHKLNVDSLKKPIKQKKYNFPPERQETIKREVEKLLEAGFIEEIQFL